MENKKINRDWVKNAAIIFLAVLLVLTFFSNTIRNRSLPEVATALASSGSITAQVRGTGTVTAAGAYEVKAPSTREIRSVMVREGQQVNAGDVLFVTGEGDSEELEQAMETLLSLEAGYQRTALSMAHPDYSLQERAIANAEELYNKALAAEQAALDNSPVISETEKETAKNKINSAQATLDSLLAERQSTIDAAEAEMNAALEALNTLPPEATEEESAAAAARFDAAKEAYAQLVNTEDAAIVAAQTTVERYEKEYETLINSDGAYKAAVEARKTAEDELYTLRFNLNQQKQQDSTASAITAVDLNSQAQQIEKQKKLVQELSGGEENQILANVGGTVASVEITAGNMAAKDTVLCTIEVPDMGYTLSFSCTTEQAKRLHVGDTATVSNYYWGSRIIATLNSIKTDPKNPSGSKLLNFDVEGDVTAGSNLTVSVGSKSANYDVIIPNSAIRSDSNGSFVLVVEAKNSPLGNRYIAVRTPIEVIASDDENSAVSGGIESGDFVITTGNRPVNPGDQVRMAD